ncbi:MAG: 30S ribosomal protein S19 [Candidatus Sungbacteria bacterium RIFCSPLOWO2_02_FULL_48_13b]|uniref:Small ribosomal subunit protein uS19 n=2 Tax=Candidatus Sungiibacteriota TaxID=1817917 RepID=A0A1G2LDY4_9BACT|nr:MAG: 30S ribosomal protein S19 [Candidatus Sungbacteria bacterium RIFCSPHIGHO2_02_FULL_49_20]OHA09836.1 MAG: 30S ribosomal protein S19 [Candidatus Sungbacteria bacterium RIFCSPLOWO2_02_FULL_48_13b]
MPRSLKKGPYIHESILKHLARSKPGNTTPIKTWARASMITPEMVGYRFGVHNGRAFIEITIKEDMVGHRLGEFAPTRKFVRHGGRMQKELETKAAEAAKEKPAGDKS